jgi:hypothetical protein
MIAYYNHKKKGLANDFIFKDELDRLSLFNRKLRSSAISGGGSSLNTNDEELKKSLKDLLSDKDLKNNLIYSCIIWSCSIFNFYLLTFYFKYFPGSIFINTIYLSFSDIISYVLSATIVKYTTANRALLIAFCTQIIGASIYLVFCWEVRLVPVFIIISRIGNSMSFNTVYIINPRLFPTKFLATCYGIENLVSHILAIGGPLMAEVPDPYPFIVFLFHAIVGSVTSFFLKEVNKSTNVESSP